MKREIKAMRLLVILFQLGMGAGVANAAVVVHTFSEDWSDPSVAGWAISGNWGATPFESPVMGSTHPSIDVAADYGVTGQWLYADSGDGSSFTASTTLTSIPAFDQISLDRFVIGAGGGIDAQQLDGLSLSINGTEVFNGNFHGRDIGLDWDNSYGGTAPPAAVLTPIPGNPLPLGVDFFGARTDAWGHDSLYDIGLDPNFDAIPLAGAGNVTILIEARLSDGTGGMESALDEQIGLANVGISFSTVPEPSSVLPLAVMLLASVMSSRWRCKRATGR